MMIADMQVLVRQVTALAKIRKQKQESCCYKHIMKLMSVIIFRERRFSIINAGGGRRNSQKDHKFILAGSAQFEDAHPMITLTGRFWSRNGAWSNGCRIPQGMSEDNRDLIIQHLQSHPL